MNICIITSVKICIEMVVMVKFLSILRKKQGLTQSDLADITGIGLNSIARYERDEVQPSIENANQIAQALHVTVDELLNGPNSEQVKITLSYDWERYEKGEIQMDRNEFELILGSHGQIGLKGAGNITSHDALEDFLARVRLQMETAFEAQVKRGAIQGA